MEYISIYYDRQLIAISKDFADLVGLKHGQHIIDPKEYAALMVAYCKHQISECDMLIAA